MGRAVKDEETGRLPGPTAAEHLTERHLTERELRYLCDIYRAYGGDCYVTPSMAANIAGVSRVTAMEMLKRLASKGYGTYTHRRGFRANTKGIALARDVLRNHRILECFMVEILGLSPEKVCTEASRFDLNVSGDVVERLNELLGKPEVCPCGNPIPQPRPPGQRGGDER